MDYKSILERYIKLTFEESGCDFPDRIYTEYPTDENGNIIGSKEDWIIFTEEEKREIEKLFYPKK